MEVDGPRIVEVARPAAPVPVVAPAPPQPLPAPIPAALPVVPYTPPTGGRGRGGDERHFSWHSSSAGPSSRGGGKGAKGGGKGKGKGKAGRSGGGVTGVVGGGLAAAVASPAGAQGASSPQRAAWRGVPLASVLTRGMRGVRTLLMVVLPTTPPLLLARPDGGALIGGPVRPELSRDSAVSEAEGWVARLTEGRRLATPQCFLAGALRLGDIEERIVVCPLATVPAGFPSLVITDPGRVPRDVISKPMAWLTLEATASQPVYSHAALTLARLASFQRPGEPRAGDRSEGAWRVGATEAARVRSTVWEGEPGRQGGFAGALARCDAADASLRAALAAVPADDPHAAYLRGMADSVQPVNASEIPDGFRGALPDYSDPMLAQVPFASRVQPPVTAPMSAPSPQPVPDGMESTRTLRELVRPEALARLGTYLMGYFEWLKWLLEAPDTCGPPKPEVFLLGPECFYEEALGFIWEHSGGDSYTLADLTRPIETHLDLGFLCEYSEGYSDQEIFGHLCYGVHLKAPQPFMCMIQPHMVSAIGRFDCVQKELARLADKSWYEILTDFPGFPFGCVQQGTCERALETARPRRTSNLTAPHKPHWDGVGQQVVPVNVAAASPDPAWAGAQGYHVGLSAPSLPLPQTDASAPCGVGLHLFSGIDHEASLGQALRAQGLGALCVDRLLGHELLNDTVYYALLSAARRGEYRYLVAGVPCETFSVARWRCRSGSARPLRGLGGAEEGLQGLSACEIEQVREANELARRTAWIAREIQASGGVYIIENPVARGEGPFSGPFWPADHVPLWSLPCMQQLVQVTDGRWLHFAQCKFGAATQKYTTLLYSPGLEGHLDWLGGEWCTHHGGQGGHVEQAVGWDERGRSRSLRAAAYPPALCDALARSLAQWAATLPPPVPVCPEGPADPGVWDTSKHPRECKPVATEAMNDLSVLEHASHLSGVPVLQSTSDFKDFFNQLATSRADRHKCGWITLALPGLCTSDPVLGYVVENVLGFGCRVASAIAQRVSELILHIFRSRMRETEDRSIYSHPALSEFLAVRERLAEATGGDEARLWVCHVYTDDPWFACLGVPLMLSLLAAWAWTTSRARIIMAIPAKQQVGTCVKWLGVRFAAGLGIAYVPPDKVQRARIGIAEARGGRATVESYRSLLGLLVHVLFLAAMRRSALFGLFTPFQSGGVAEWGPATPLEGAALTPLMLSQLGAWDERLGQCAGAPFFTAIPRWARHTVAPSRCVAFLRSDAAKEGAAVPGICGNFYGRYWIHTLSSEELELPIALLEFVGGCGNVVAFGQDASQVGDVLLEYDAKASAQVMVSGRAHAPLMQHALRRLEQRWEYQAIEACLMAGHMYGPGNPVTDAGSRGREPLLIELMGQLGLRACRVPTPTFVPELLLELVELRRHLAGAELFGKEYSSDVTGDGPPTWHPYIPVASVGGRLHSFSTGASTSRRVESGRQPAVGPRVGKPALAPPQPAAGAVGVGARLPPPPCSAPPVSAPVVPTMPAVCARPVVYRPWSSQCACGPRLAGPLRSEARPPHVAAFVATQLRSSADSLVSLLQSDTSPFAIPSCRMHLVDEIALDVYELAQDGVPDGTKRQMRSDWKAWCVWCAHLGVSPWRFDTRANSGLDEVGSRREAFILAGGLRFIYNRMQPRSRKDPVPKPQSAYNVILGIRRLHKGKGYPMVAMPQVGAVVKGLMRRVQQEYGESHPSLLLPKRKEPFTRDMLDRLSAIQSGQVPFGRGQKLDWATARGRSLWALLCTLCCTGFRKSEVARTSGEERRPIAMRGSVCFRIGGDVHANPSAALLRSMGPGDCAILTPPPSKADQFGLVWGASPIYLPWGAEVRNAARALAEMEIGDPLVAEARAKTPLFSAGDGAAFTGSALDSVLSAMLHSIGLSAAEAAKYSWHSARIYLACALLAAGASAGQIQALCRWLSEESLHIYARMNETTYGYWINRAMRADVNSSRTTSLVSGSPPLDDDEVVSRLLSLSFAETD